jgi:CheY-like chemotaxis protein
MMRKIGVYIIRQKLILEGVFEEKEILTFLSAKEALHSLTQCSDEEIPDIILLDLNMPEMDGWQFLNALAPYESRFKERCRIYILTSSIVFSDEAKAKENPMVSGIIHKPISAENIRTLSSLKKYYSY